MVLVVNGILWACINPGTALSPCLKKAAQSYTEAQLPEKDQLVLKKNGPIPTNR